MIKAIFAFDFSISKPAMCALINKKIYFYTWPALLDEKSEAILKNNNVNVYNRNIQPISKKCLDSNSLVIEHIKRSETLTDLIKNDIIKLINEHSLKNEEIIISSEGLSFGSKGDATLNLAAYKQVLLNKLFSIGLFNIKTYSPISIKSVAGCSKKGKTDKKSVIDAIKEENPNLHKFIKTIIFEEHSLKKKTAFIPTVDDLVDAFWCLKTTIIKEELNICI